MKYTSRHIRPKVLFGLALSLLLIIFFRYLILNVRTWELEWKIVWLRVFYLAIFFVLLSSFVTYYEYHGIGPQDGIVRRGPKGTVAITFDDGPHPVFTPKILDVLKRKKVKATFFVLGKHVEKYPEITQRIVEEGHDIANHTYTHRDLAPTTRQIVLHQIRKTEKAIFKATGVKTNLFRPPRGIYSNTVRKLLIKEGYKIILWTVSTLDWRQVSAEKMLRRVKLYVRDGGIVLFHDSGALLRREGASRERTIEALPLIIDYLRNEQGFKIIPVSEMLYRLGKAESEVLLGRAK